VQLAAVVYRTGFGADPSNARALVDHSREKLSEQRLFWGFPMRISCKTRGFLCDVPSSVRLDAKQKEYKIWMMAADLSLDAGILLSEAKSSQARRSATSHSQFLAD
jgi:hypothetical protein